MRILVTGATGVLGRRVVPMLAGAGHDVTAVSRGRPEQIRRAGGTPVELDLFDHDAVTRAVAGHQAVLDLATRIPSASRMALPWAWRDNDRLRRDAAPAMARAAARAGARYVRESIALLYDDGGDRWVDEGHAVAPLSNTRTALVAEAAAHEVTRAGGTGIVLRFAMFYGPDSTHMREQLASAARGTAAVIGDPDGFLSQLHLDDAASALLAALDAPAGTYNVGEDQPLRRRELVEVFEQIAGRPLRTPPGVVARIGPARAVARSLRVSSAAFRAATGWTPLHPSAREGLPRVAAQTTATADA